MDCELVSAGHRARAQQAGEHMINIGADLHHAAAEENGNEVSHHFAHVRRVHIQAQPQRCARAAAPPATALRIASALPATEPHARVNGQVLHVAVPPNITSVAIMAAFQITGAV